MVFFTKDDKRKIYITRRESRTTNKSQWVTFGNIFRVLIIITCNLLKIAIMW